LTALLRPRRTASTEVPEAKGGESVAQETETGWRREDAHRTSKAEETEEDLARQVDETSEHSGRGRGARIAKRWPHRVPPRSSRSSGWPPAGSTGRDAVGARIRVFGRLEALPDRLRETIARVEAATGDHQGLTLNVALGYSGRDELVDATRALIRSLAASGIAAHEMGDYVSSEALAAHLYTAEHSDPDLIIRTSGEMRLSGFLPWQSTHSEFYFTDVYRPAFRELDFLRAVRTFQQRERRFGR
jgi:Putative undecaprenyl diphosphate synthase